MKKSLSWGGGGGGGVYACPKIWTTGDIISNVPHGLEVPKEEGKQVSESPPPPPPPSAQRLSHAWRELSKKSNVSSPPPPPPQRWGEISAHEITWRVYPYPCIILFRVCHEGFKRSIFAQSPLKYDKTEWFNLTIFFSKQEVNNLPNYIHVLMSQIAKLHNLSQKWKIKSVHDK